MGQCGFFLEVKLPCLKPKLKVLALCSPEHSPTFMVPGTGFMENSFSTAGGGWGGVCGVEVVRGVIPG